MGLSSSDTYQSCNEIEHIAEDEVVEDCDIEIPNLRYGVAVGDYDYVDEGLDYTRVDEELDHNRVQGVASSPISGYCPSAVFSENLGGISHTQESGVRTASLILPIYWSYKFSLFKIPPGGWLAKML